MTIADRCEACDDVSIVMDEGGTRLCASCMELLEGDPFLIEDVAFHMPRGPIERRRAVLRYQTMAGAVLPDPRPRRRSGHQEDDP